MFVKEFLIVGVREWYWWFFVNGIYRDVLLWFGDYFFYVFVVFIV